MSAIQLLNVTVRYDGCPAVLDVSVDIAAGQWCCIIGANGAGKSSLLRASLGLVGHDGHIAVDGVDLARLPASERARRIAYVPQSPLLPDGMTAREYVLLGRTPYISRFGWESAHDRHLAEQMLDRLDLTMFANRPLGSLSGGERQRIVIARALAQEVPILLLDEPTSALDIGHQQQALDLIDTLRRERDLTVISAMHDLTLAGQYSDRLVLMHLGSVVADGTADVVLDETVLARYYGARVRILRDDDGSVVVVPARTNSSSSPIHSSRRPATAGATSNSS